MRRGRIKMKLKGRRRDLSKNLLCDFCGSASSSSSRYEQRSHERDHQSMSMENELRRLRLLTRRMTGKDLDGLSFTELLSLESRLKTVLLIVKDKKKKLEEDERLLKQKNKAEDDDDDGTRVDDFVVPCCKFSTSSTGERQDDESTPLLRMQIAFERRNAESMLDEYERLWVLKERLNGRELDGMNSAELDLLVNQIQRGLLDLQEQLLAPTMEEMARKRREEVDHLSVKRCSRS